MGVMNLTNMPHKRFIKSFTHNNNIKTKIYYAFVQIYNNAIYRYMQIKVILTKEFQTTFNK